MVLTIPMDHLPLITVDHLRHLPITEDHHHLLPITEDLLHPLEKDRVDFLQELSLLT